MSLEAAFDELRRAFREVDTAFVGLRLTAVEDQPKAGSVALVDWLADFVEDLGSAVQVGSRAAELGTSAAQVPRDLEASLRSLLEGQRVRDLIQERLSEEGGEGSRLKELRRFGRERGGEWRAWTDEVFGALVRCRDRVAGLVDPLFVCWQDLAEVLASPLISVRTTSIGQHITLASEEGIPR